MITDSVNDMEMQSRKFMNGEHIMIYKEAFVTVGGPIPSLNVKILRQTRKSMVRIAGALVRICTGYLQQVESSSRLE